MKKLIMITALLALTAQMKAFTPWTKGGFETGQYRNVFVEMGYESEAVEAKLKEVFNKHFLKPKKARSGKKLGKEHYYVSNVESDEDLVAMVDDVAVEFQKAMDDD